MEAAAIAASSDEELAEAIEQLHALISVAQAEMFDLIRVLAARQAFAVDGCRDMASWLVARLSISKTTARLWADTANSLGALPALRQLFEQGGVSLDQLAPVARVATEDTDETLAGQVADFTAAEAETFARRAKAVDPADEQEAHRRRRLGLRWSGQSLRLSGSLPALEGETVRAALARIADGYGPNPDTGLFDPYDARLADALVDLAGQRLVDDSDPDRATVIVHVEQDVLAGEDGPAETGDGVPLSAESARRASCDSRCQQLIRDLRTGRLDLGRTTRTIPPHLARYLRHRDGGCRFPGCGARRLVQGHHIVHWTAAGPTDRSNLASLCRRCHRLVHEGGWRVEGDGEDELTFVSPRGRRLTSRRAPLRDDIRRRFFGEGRRTPPRAGP